MNPVNDNFGVAMSVRENPPQLTLKQKNIMGVVVPEIESSKVQEEPCRARLWRARDIRGH